MVKGKLISLCGPAQCGKGEMTRELVRHGWKQIKFAGAIKAMLRAMLQAAKVDGFEIQEMLEGTLKEVPHAALQGKSPRHALQTLGTEWGRECIDENLWASLTLAEAEWWRGHGHHVVIDDMRFENEFRMVVNKGGLCYRIKRPDQAFIPAADHASENGLDHLHMPVIVNEGSVEELHRLARIVGEIAP